MIDKAFAYIANNQDRFLEEFKEFLRFPSVSAQSAHANDILACAQWLKSHFEGIGLESQIIETEGHPIVRARGAGSSQKRMVIYGHYDVQPEDPLDQWDTPPFAPSLRDGYIYARGASDDKGQLFAHIKAVESLLKGTGELPCEVVFLVEGEEESGGDALAKYLEQEKQSLPCEAVVVSDMAMYDENTPAITYGLRGLGAMEVVVTGPCKDVHSGSFGGAMANPTVVLSHIISKCIDENGTICIPGFYDDVRELAQWEKDNITQLAFDESQLCRELKINKTFGEDGFSVLERLWARPTFEISGIFGGYGGQGCKTIIPAKATCKITMRMVPDQCPQKIAHLAADYIRSICPDTVNISIDISPFAAVPVLFDVHNPIVQAARQALRKGFGSEPVFIREGGSVPVVEAFARQLQCPVLLMGFGLHSDGPHSPNERFKIDNFVNGMKSSASLLAGIV